MGLHVAVGGGIDLLRLRGGLLILQLADLEPHGVGRVYIRQVGGNGGQRLLQAAQQGVFRRLLVIAAAGIEAVEGRDHGLLGEDAGQDADRGLPVLFPHAYGVQHRGHRLAELAQH
ncbi:hypothetical protein D3C78_1484600 [compost metagenome]